MNNLSSTSNNINNIEALDKLLNANLIDDHQVKAGLTFRILRYKKFGKSACTSKDYENISFKDTTQNDNKEINQKLFNDSLKKLKEINAESAVLDVCVYNILPKNILILNKVKNGLKLLTEFYSESFFSIR